MFNNFRPSFVNSACGVREKVTIDGVDEIVSAKRPRHANDRIVGCTWNLKSVLWSPGCRASLRLDQKNQLSFLVDGRAVGASTSGWTCGLTSNFNVRDAQKLNQTPRQE